MKGCGGHDTIRKSTSSKLASKNYIGFIMSRFLIRGLSIFLFNSAIVFVFLAAPSNTFAQSGFKVGDQVEVKDNFDKRIYKGVVQQVLPLGSGYMIQYTDKDGRSERSIFQANEVRKPAATIEFRTWKTRKGAFSVEAKFVSATDDTVKLKKKDGETLDVKINLLVPDDKRYIRKARELVKSGGGGESSEAAKSIFDYEAIDIDFSSVKSFLAAQESGSFTPDAATLVIESPTQTALADKPTGAVLFPNRKNGMFVFGDELGGRYSMQVVDFTTGKVVGAFQVPAFEAKPTGISPNNSYVVTLASRINRDARFDIWKLEGKKFVHKQGILGTKKSSSGQAAGGSPRGGFGGGTRGGFGGGTRGGFGGGSRGGFGERLGGAPDVEGDKRFEFDEVEFLNSRTVYMRTFFEMFVVDIVTGKASLVADFAGGKKPGFSANRKYMVFPDGRENLVIFDCEELSVVKKIPAKLVDSAIFSNDGTKVVALRNEVKQSQVYVFDVATSEIDLEMTLPFGVNKIHWSGKSHLIVDSEVSKLIIDVELGGPILKYLHLEELKLQVGQRSFAMVDMLSSKITVEHFPSQNDLNQNVDMSKLFVQLEGNDVAVDTSKLNAGLLNGKISDRIKKHVTDNGGTLASGAKLKLVAETYAEAKTSVTYSKRGRLEPGAKRDENTEYTQIFYTPYTSKISLVENGVEVWSKSSTSSWHQKMKGTKAELQRDADAASKPDPTLFLLGKLPVRVPRKDVWDKEIPTLDRRRIGFR